MYFNAMSIYVQEKQESGLLLFLLCMAISLEGELSYLV